MRYSLSTVLFLIILLSADAHRMKVFATVEHDSISGYGYFAGGGAPANLKVLVLAPDRTRLGETMTNEAGEFSFTPTVRVDHIIVLQTPDGHLAEYTVPAAELPESLSTGKEEASIPAVTSAEAAELQEPSLPEKISLQDVEEAIRRQINPLRRELERFEERNRLQDILGGIGYIIGITGIAFYFMTKRKKKNS